MILLLLMLVFTEEVKRLVLTAPVESKATATARITVNEHGLRLIVIAVGLQPRCRYVLYLSSEPVAEGLSDADGTLDFYVESEPRSADRLELLDTATGEVVLWARLQPLLYVPNIVVEAGKTATVEVKLDEPEADLRFALSCSRGSFVTFDAGRIIASPRESDVGELSCELVVTDRFGLSNSAYFAVTVLPPNRPPVITVVPQQVVKAGSIRNVLLQASDPNDPTNAGLRFSLVAAPEYAVLTDVGAGRAVIQLSPPITATGRSEVVVQVREPQGLVAQTAFTVVIEPTVVITDVSYSKTFLIINGSGFGTSATVKVNDVDVTRFLVGQSNHSITLKARRSALGLRSGPNRVQVSVGSVASNLFIFSL